MERITYDATILGGKPIIKNTRISVDFILELLASGMTPEEILTEYPPLRLDDLKAALQYAAESIKHEDVISLVLS